MTNHNTDDNDMVKDHLTHFTDVLGDATEGWHLWCAGIFQGHPDTRCPQYELLGLSIQLQVMSSGELFMLTSVL